MLHSPDSEGRYPLSSKEYIAIRYVIVSLYELEQTMSALEDRVKTIQGGMKNYEILRNTMEQFEEQLLDTVPTKKLYALQQELRNSEVGVFTKWDQRKIKNAFCVDQDALLALLNRLIGYECWSCEKRGKDAKKCEILRTYLDCLHYVPEEMPPDGSCPMAGWTSVKTEE